MNDVNLPKYSLITYTRDRKNNPRGMLVAVPSGNNGNFRIGYAQCRKEDKFNKKMGLKIALGRADSESYSSIDNMPHDLRRIFPGFIKRCEKYYKT